MRPITKLTVPWLQRLGILALVILFGSHGSQLSAYCSSDAHRQVPKPAEAGREVTKSSPKRSDLKKVVPLVRAHAHNDYHHKRPLLDALAHGFCSVEADVFLVRGQLLVGHHRFELRRERSLKQLYLDPLRKRIEDEGGRVFKKGPPLVLLIDFKTDGSATYRALDQLLVEYDEILTRWIDGKQQEGAITVVISGNRPTPKAVASQSPRYVSLDGRLGDLDKPRPKDDPIFLISDHWGSHFRWKGRGAFSTRERNKLHRLVAKAHAQGRKIRFWATPDRRVVWKELFDAGVDLINTDDLGGLARFLREQAKESAAAGRRHNVDNRESLIPNP